MEIKAQIDNFNGWIKENEPIKLKEYFDDLLSKCGFKIINFMEYHFEPQGYTALYLLSESHFAIHTFPEHGKSYIELSSCNEQYFLNFVKHLKYKLI